MEKAVRLSVSFTAVQYERAAALAARLGITKGEAFRRLVDEALEARKDASKERQ